MILAAWLRKRVSAVLAVAAGTGLAAAIAVSAWPAHSDVVDVRKLPMRFEWVAGPEGRNGWISAAGVITEETPKEFEAFAARHDLKGATVVLDSSGGSVNDAIALGRRWRGLGLRTTVGLTIDVPAAMGRRASVIPAASCESMCVFLLLSGRVRYVPLEARVRVHQIWMGDRADDAKAASYTAQDLMIVERDLGRLAKYTFEMGGTGDLLELALSVPPWEALHQLSPEELRKTNIVTTEAASDVLPSSGDRSGVPIATVSKPIQDRIPETAQRGGPAPKGTRTAEVAAPVGGAVNAAGSAQPR